MRRSENPGMSSLGRRQLKTLLYPLQNIQNISTTSSTVPLFQLHFIPRRKQSHWTESPFVQQPAIPKTIIHSSTVTVGPSMVLDQLRFSSFFYWPHSEYLTRKPDWTLECVSFLNSSFVFKLLGQMGFSSKGTCFGLLGFWNNGLSEQWTVNTPPKP